MFDSLKDIKSTTIIKVVGIGGGGCNTVNSIHSFKNDSVEFIAVNTDVQALKMSACENTIQIGACLTGGFGAGGDPDVGRQAAIEDRDRIAKVLSGAHIVMIVAGMGGGTGTGASSIFADIARDIGAVVIGIVTTPFKFEGARRHRIANRGLDIFSQCVDTLITVPNSKLMEVLGGSVTLHEAFTASNSISKTTVEGISNLLTAPSLINVDFSDIRTVMSEMGSGIVSIGSATGKNRAIDAVDAAISNPFLYDIPLSQAQAVLVNIQAGSDFTLGELTVIGDRINSLAADDASVVVGSSISEEQSETVQVSVIATGIVGKIYKDENVQFHGKFRSRDEFVTEVGIKYKNSLSSSSPIRVIVDDEVSDESIADFINILSSVYSKEDNDHLKVINAYPLNPKLETLDVPNFFRRQAD